MLWKSIGLGLKGLVKGSVLQGVEHDELQHWVFACMPADAWKSKGLFKTIVVKIMPIYYSGSSSEFSITGNVCQALGASHISALWRLRNPKRKNQLASLNHFLNLSSWVGFSKPRQLWWSIHRATSTEMNTYIAPWSSQCSAQYVCTTLLFNEN